VSIALYCIIFEIKRDTVRKSIFSYPMHCTPPLWGSSRNTAVTFGVETLEWCGYPMVKKLADTFSSFDTIPACDSRTDKQMEIHVATARSALYA